MPQKRPHICPERHRAFHYCVGPGISRVYMCYPNTASGFPQPPFCERGAFPSSKMVPFIALAGAAVKRNGQGKFPTGGRKTFKFAANIISILRMYANSKGNQIILKTCRKGKRDCRERKVSRQSLYFGFYGFAPVFFRSDRNAFRSPAGRGLEK